MLNSHSKISYRLAGLSLVAALAAVPNALAVPVMPEGGPPDPLVGPLTAPTLTSDPATVVHASSGFDWSTAGLVIAIGLAVLAITLAMVFAIGRHGRQLAAR